MMDTFEQQVDLQPLNTFGVRAYANRFLRLTSTSTLKQLIRQGIDRQSPLFLGQGSNIVLCDATLNQPIIKNELKGIRVIASDASNVWIEVAAGESWTQWVEYALAKGWFGLENLSLIPGTVGAAPVQNIGAYGVEVANYINSVVCVDLSDPCAKAFELPNSACHFGYRDSFFKTSVAQSWLIIAVQFRLSTTPHLSTTYGAITHQLETVGITRRLPTPHEVAQAVIALRKQALPEPNQWGNAGSFFKNPIVSTQQADTLIKRYPQLPTYLLPNGEIKLAAGWLIEQAGLKGYQIGGAAVHRHHALILINKEEASGEDIANLASHIVQIVSERYGVTLEPEPVFVKNKATPHKNDALKLT